MSNPLLSPALSTASASSYDMMSSLTQSISSSSSAARWTHASESDDESGDDIVWSVAGSSVSSNGSEFSSESSTESSDFASDDDFIILSRPRSPGTVQSALSPSEHNVGSSPPDGATSTVQLAAELEALTMSESSSPSVTTSSPTTSKGLNARQRRRESRKQLMARAASHPLTPVKLTSSAATLIPRQSQNNAAGSPKSKKKKKQVGATSGGLGSRPIVDDISECLSVNEDDETSVTGPSIHQEAFSYISSFLSNPEAKNDSVCHLTLLQSLIIELGLGTSSLPASLTAAKAFLKSHAFLNIREYLAVRGQGPDAVQKVMHPSRNALIRDIRKKKNPASLKWVKQHGLQVLLVSCFR